MSQAIDAGEGEGWFSGWVRVENNRIVAVNTIDVPLPEGIDQGCWWAIRDARDHRCAQPFGRLPSAFLSRPQRWYEATSPVTAEVWAEHSGGPKILSFLGACRRSNNAQILPGSANLFGAQCNAQECLVPNGTRMKFPCALRAKDAAERIRNGYTGAKDAPRREWGILLVTARFDPSP